jgi:hypothetical protein
MKPPRDAIAVPNEVVLVRKNISKFNLVSELHHFCINARRFTDLDELDFVKLGYGGLVLGSIPFLLSQFKMHNYTY